MIIDNRSFSSVFRLLRFPMKRERKLDGMEGRREISKLAPIIVPLAMVHPPTPMMNGDLEECLHFIPVNPEAYFTTFHNVTVPSA